ncbi:MAG TPA: XdhC family protein [Xanthobacteraceae bacterium]|nr:XdhC family protein [Xanthobacteraceae bacterium]
MDVALLHALNAERAARRACVLVTDLSSGAQRLVTAAQAPADPLAAVLAEALRTGRSGMAAAGERVFLTVQVPPPRLVVTGAVHISQMLAPMARLAGFAVTIVDPRTGFATAQRFPDADLHAAWPDQVLPALALDGFTAFVALSHDPKIDDPGLAEALARGCFYVGALGSRKSHAGRLARLAGLGVRPEALGRIRGPVGLDIGAVSPAEIAVSILAELVAALRRPAPAQERAA